MSYAMPNSLSSLPEPERQRYRKKLCVDGVALKATPNAAHKACWTSDVELLSLKSTAHVELSERDIKAFGTVRANRKGMRTNFPSDKEMKRGDIASFSVDGIACVKWMDNRAVLLLSNFISPVQTVLVQRQSAGRKEKMDVHCPLVVKEYNKAMGGVDLMDQKKVTYEVDRRAKIKYYLRICFDLLDIGVNNAYIYYMKLQAKMLIFLL
ncbi:hypothetical protein HPB47_004067 [Ixodes persulcatus]|uniref:Uncharacterized protein n=1 Tax=Ixodes persulcatus TaxID=34615 RepID=A0AC60PGR3_IXOPE|nr:hypothetical protein HPB47_004067 [Ixodes persulcatus]